MGVEALDREQQLLFMSKPQSSYLAVLSVKKKKKRFLNFPKIGDVAYHSFKYLRLTKETAKTLPTDLALFCALMMAEVLLEVVLSEEELSACCCKISPLVISWVEIWRL